MGVGRLIWTLLPLRCKCAARPWCCAQCLAMPSHRGSNLRSLAHKQACSLFLLYSLRASKAIGFWHFVLCCDNVATLAEQAAAAVLMSKLLDTSALAYLRRRTLCVRRCKGGQILSSPPKRKIRNTRMGIPYFWRRRKDLNLRAGYPTYTLSRGASSPLEYFSIKQAVVFISLPNYYINFFVICQYLF